MPVSRLFEEISLLPGECSLIIRQALLELEDMYECVCAEEEMIDSLLSRFALTEDKDGQQILKSPFMKRGHMLRKSIHQETVEIPLDNYPHLNESSLKVAQNVEKNIVSDVMKSVKTRFESFDNPILQHMKWLDPNVWEDDNAYGRDLLEFIANHFAVPLSLTRFDHKFAIIEWKRFKTYMKANFEDKLVRNEMDAKRIWKYVLLYKIKDFPNLCLLVQMIFSISGSNSATERSFFVLTLLLTDCHTKFAHNTIRMLLSIKINDHLWSEQERDDIISAAVDLYMSAPRKKQVDSPETNRQEKVNQPPLIEIDSDNDNESEVDFEKDIESDKNME